MIVKYSISSVDFIRLHRSKGLPLWRRSVRWLVPGWTLFVFCSVAIVSVVNKRPTFGATVLPLVVCVIFLIAVWIVRQYSWKNDF